VSPERQAELEAERQFLLRSLSDLELEHDAGDVDDHDYTTLRDGYTARAAAIIRELERGAQPVAAPTGRSWGKTVAWVAIVAAIAISAGVLVARSFGERSPSDASMTGGLGDRSTGQLLSEARQAMGTDPVRAIELFSQVEDVDPDNVEAITYSAWLTVAAALQSGNAEFLQTAARPAEAQFDRAIELDPSYPDPHCFKAIVRFFAFDDAAGAKPFADTCLAANPPQEARAYVEALLARIDAKLAEDPPSDATTTTTAP